MGHHRNMSPDREAEQPARASRAREGPKGKEANGFKWLVCLTPVSCRVSVGGVSTTGPVVCPVLQLLNAQEIPV